MKKAYRVTFWCENGYPYTPQWFRKLEKANYDSIAYRHICAKPTPTITPHRHVPQAFFEGAGRLLRALRTRKPSPKSPYPRLYRYPAKRDNPGYIAVREAN